MDTTQVFTPYRLATETAAAYHADKRFFSRSLLETAVRWVSGEPVWTPERFKQACCGAAFSKGGRHFDVGTGFHLKASQPELFDKEVAVAPPEASDGRTKAYKEWAASVAGKIILKPDEYDTICRMVDSMNAHPLASELMAEIQWVECSIRWQDEESDLLLKARPDVEVESAVIDLKTAESSLPCDWLKDAAAFGYHRQAAHYLDGIEAVSSLKLPFYHIVVAKEPPYETVVYKLPQTAISLGHEQNRAMRLKIREWMSEMYESATAAGHEFKDTSFWDHWMACSEWAWKVCENDLPYYAYPKNF